MDLGGSGVIHREGENGGAVLGYANVTSYGAKRRPGGKTGARGGACDALALKGRAVDTEAVQGTVGGHSHGMVGRGFRATIQALPVKAAYVADAVADHHFQVGDARVRVLGCSKGGGKGAHGSKGCTKLKGRNRWFGKA